MIAVILWIIFSVVVGSVASNKGRSGVGFFLVSLVLSPLVGLIIALVLQPNKQLIEQKAIASNEMKKCPVCAEVVKQEAIMCRHCHTQFHSASHTTKEQQQK